MNNGCENGRGGYKKGSPLFLFASCSCSSVSANGNTAIAVFSLAVFSLSFCCAVNSPAFELAFFRRRELMLTVKSVFTEFRCASSFVISFRRSKNFPL